MKKDQKPMARANNGRGDLATGVVTFVVGALITAYLFITNGDYKPKETYWFINTGLCMWAPLVTILLVLRQDPGQFGLQRGDAKLGMKWALLLWMGMLIPAVLQATQPAARAYYLENNLTVSLWGLGPVFDRFAHHVNLKALLYYELAMGFYMFCWEFFFRGFLLFGFLKTRLGAVGAVILQTIPFVLLHWSWNAHASKPSLEVIGSAIAAPILGFLAIRTRSMLYGFISHWAVSLTFDLFILAPFIFNHIG